VEEKSIEKLGLSPGETKVYLALVEDGSSLAGKISKKTGLNRTSVYDAIEKLIKKGLASYVNKENRKYFEAESPQKLKALLEKKEAELKDIRKTIPSLMKLFDFKREKQEASVFEGLKGLKAVMENLLNELKEGDEQLVFGAAPQPDYIDSYLVNWSKRRVKRKIKARIVFCQGTKRAEKIKDMSLTKVRFVTEEQTTPASINIFGNNVAIMIWTKEPIAFVMKGKEIGESFKKYFELLWSTAKE
jgi:HTH-type transcriptional regulator, sugar sensing transcriptional regulator